MAKKALMMALFAILTWFQPTQPANAQEITVHSEGSLHLSPSGLMELSFERPIFVNLELLDTRFEVGAYAVYQGEGESGETFRHTFVVEALAVVDGKPCYKISVSRDHPPKSTISMFASIIEDLPGQKHHRVSGVHTGTANRNLSGLEMESFIGEGREATLHLMGREITTLRKDFVVGDKKAGELWVHQGLGPLSIAQARVYRENKWVTYQLVDYGINLEREQ